MSKTGSRPTPQEILKKNRAHAQDEPTRAADFTDDGLDVVQAFADEHVDEQVIITSKRIRKRMDADHVLVEDIGRALSASLEGLTPAWFLADIEVSRWRGTRQAATKWQIEPADSEVDR